MRMIRTCAFVAGTCAALVCLVAPADGFAQAWKQTTCDRNAPEGQDACDATPFRSASIGSKLAESFHYTTDHTMTSRKFLYDWLGGPSNGTKLQSFNSNTVEEGLFFGCDGTSIRFPQDEPRDYVTLMFANFDPRSVNFLAVNSSGQIIDEETKTTPNEDFGVVTLGPDPRSGSSYDISKVYMWHVDDSTCTIECTEPFISEVRACDVRLP